MSAIYRTGDPTLETVDEETIPDSYTLLHRFVCAC